MTAATLPTPDDIALAVEDIDHYAAIRASLSGPDKAWFTAAVDEAYEAAHGPARRLSERDLRILAFARRRFPNPGSMEAAIREQFGLSATRYHQILNALIDRPQALAADPVLVGRLRRLREARRIQRAARNHDSRSAD